MSQQDEELRARVVKAFFDRAVKEAERWQVQVFFGNGRTTRAKVTARQFSYSPDEIAGR